MLAGKGDLLKDGSGSVAAALLNGQRLKLLYAFVPLSIVADCCPSSVRRGLAASMQVFIKVFLFLARFK
jgi:hypothetical protein